MMLSYLYSRILPAFTLGIANFILENILSSFSVKKDFLSTPVVIKLALPAGVKLSAFRFFIVSKPFS